MRNYIVIGCVSIVMWCIVVVFLFYQSYEQLAHSLKASDYLKLIINSIKRAGIIFLLFVVFILSQIICKHYQVGFVISFIVSVIIALGFLGFCKLFNIKNPAHSDVMVNRHHKDQASKIGKD